MKSIDLSETRMNATHYYYAGDWVDALNSVEPQQVEQRRREVAARLKVEVGRIVVMRLDEVKYK